MFVENMGWGKGELPAEFRREINIIFVVLQSA